MWVKVLAGKYDDSLELDVGRSGLELCIFGEERCRAS